MNWNFQGETTIDPDTLHKLKIAKDKAYKKHF